MAIITNPTLEQLEEDCSLLWDIQSPKDILYILESYYKKYPGIQFREKTQFMYAAEHAILEKSRKNQKRKEIIDNILFYILLFSCSLLFDYFVKLVLVNRC